MERRRRSLIIVPVIICALTLGALTRSHALESVRAVDALMLFVAGAAAGVSLTAVLVSRRG